MENFATIGNYHLIDKIASGAFGRVYRAEHAVLRNRIVAIKVLHSVHIETASERENFFREARLLEMLRHPLILSLIDVGVEDNTPYLVTELATGGSLRQKLSAAANQQQTIALTQSSQILQQIAQALHFAHQHNIIHRDLKPENILFNDKGDALIADFGNSQNLRSQSFQQGSVAGTPLYMAPEQFKGIISKASDQYALGCIAYELLTGRTPFPPSDLYSLGFKHLMEQPTPPHILNPQLPEHISQAVMRALEKERADRHPDVLNFVSAFDRSAKQWLHEGNQFFAQQEYERAISCYEQALHLTPKNANLHHSKAIALTQLQRNEEALEAYRQTNQLEPQFALAYYNKGNVLHQLKSYEEALEAYRQAITIDPHYSLAYYNMGTMLEILQRPQEALSAYEQATLNNALRLDPSYAIAYRKTGILALHLNNYSKALTVYEQAIRIAPNSARAYIGKGLALLYLNSYEEALSVFEQALRTQTDTLLALSGKIIALELLNREEEAQEFLQTASNTELTTSLMHLLKESPLKNLNTLRKTFSVYESRINFGINYSHNTKEVIPPE